MTSSPSAGARYTVCRPPQNLINTISSGNGQLARMQIKDINNLLSLRQW
ncbi:hypothetical protein OIU79_011750 [Salix purpurea]|uniref:Uncharacterized protein n=1 Tax=Salix purpurea TaxID=77065 RepID=A0A9Q0Q1L0_SALPP|nr:hypothetical protein OIU79_011750 [Salix purpurea]